MRSEITELCVEINDSKGEGEPPAVVQNHEKDLKHLIEEMVRGREEMARIKESRDRLVERCENVGRGVAEIVGLFHEGATELFNPYGDRYR